MDKVEGILTPLDRCEWGCGGHAQVGMSTPALHRQPRTGSLAGPSLVGWGCCVSGVQWEGTHTPKVGSDHLR